MVAADTSKELEVIRVVKGLVVPNEIDEVVNEIYGFGGDFLVLAKFDLLPIIALEDID
jgi:hypothetical protein